MNYGMFTKEQLYGDQGHPRTKSLFREFGGGPLSYSKHDTDGCINLRNIYISLCVDDPTEFVFAEEVFGDWSFWAHLRNISWMKAQVEEWQVVVEVERKSRAFKALVQDASDPKSRSRVASAKYLIEEPWKNKKDRDTKKQVEATASSAYDQSAKDLERIKEHLQ